MTDEATTMAAASADVQPSQIIEPQETHEVPRAGTLPEAEQPKQPEKPLSTRDAIAKAFDEAEKAAKDKAVKAADDAKAKAEEITEKPKAEEKPAKPRGEDGKFAKVEKAENEPADEKAEKSEPEKAAAGQDGSERRQSEGRQHHEPPARFLPEARTKWANVPKEVKAEFHRVSQEYEAELEKGRQATERYESIRQFDEIARANGRELKDSLTKVVQIEQMLARNPIAGIDAILKEVGPRKADGSPLSLFEVAQHIVQQGPQAYQHTVSAAQARPVQQPEVNSEIQALKAEIQSLRAEQTVVPVIREFSRSHPDFDALSPQIEKILGSGVIEQIYGQGLSAEQKLSEAYRMAGGRMPSSRSESEAEPAHSEAATPARPVDPDGQKSIKGAPTSGRTGEAKWVPKSNREALERAFASVR